MHDEVIDEKNIDGYHRVKKQRVDEVPHPYEKIFHETLENIVSQQCQKDPCDAYPRKRQFTDENSRALPRFVDRVDVIGCWIVVFQAVPAKLVAAGTRHMRAAGGLLDGYFAARALVGEEEEIDEPDYRLEVQPARRCQYC